MKKVEQPHGGSINLLEKGESGNLKGKPKGTLNVKTVIRKWLEAEDLTDDTKRFLEQAKIQESQHLTHLEVMTLKLMAKAKRGDVPAYKALVEQIDAKPKQEIDITSAGERIGTREIILRDYKESDKELET